VDLQTAVEVKVALRSDIGLANRIIPMSFACKGIGMPDVDYALSGAKVDCPFSTLFHPGSGKSFRIYDDASAYCYACAQSFRAVDIYAQAKDISLDEAAEQLLESFGYKEATAEERYAQAVEHPVVIDQRALEEALKTYCARNFPSWEVDQFDETVAAKFRQCVNLLPSVRTAEETKTWLTATKQAMTKVLGDIK
jgi:hypothetical protein